MFGIRFIKFNSTTYVVHYKNGKVVKEGRGLSFFYFAPTSSIIAVPMGSNDIPFIFNESTKDFQTISIQGQITYKIESPKLISELLDFSVDHHGYYLVNDIEKLNQRLINQAQTTAVSFCQSILLKDALRSVRQIEQTLNDGITKSNVAEMLGVKVLGINIIDVKATPEMAKALEAETREALQQDADEAIYKRRNFSVEQERTIKESELNTEIAVEEKKKQIAEKTMEIEILKEEQERKLREMRILADTEIESRRKALLDLKIANDKKEADSKSYYTKVTLEPYKEMDWRVLLAIQSSSNNPQANIAIAFRELAENSSKINNLNITPDLLQSIMANNEG